MQTKKFWLSLVIGVSYMATPFLFLQPKGASPPAVVFLFYLFGICFVVSVARIHSLRKNRLKVRSEDIQSRINVCHDLIDKESTAQAALAQKMHRYASLRRLVSQVNESLTLEAIADRLVTQCFSLVADHQGACFVYLLDKEGQQLRLLKTRQDDSAAACNDQHGDIFDQWVLRHASPLLVEDCRKDFRFDLQRPGQSPQRSFSSLIAVPLVSATHLVGLMRLDHPDPRYYNQEDLRFLATISDIAAVALENGMLYEDTERLALHDGLTGLFTKGHFFELLDDCVRRSDARDRRFSLLMVDIDHFKAYNDSFGHIAGDIVLRTLSETVQSFFKDAGAPCGRFGGEEFCVLLPGASRREAVDGAERLRATIEQTTMLLRRQPTRVTVSIGVACFPDDGQDASALLMKADKALYEAKQSGRNRVVATV